MSTRSELMFREEAAFPKIVRVTVNRWFTEQERRDVDPDAIGQTRRSGLMHHALVPLEAARPPEQLRRLRFAALVVGAEALIVKRDVRRLDPDEATDVLRWAAATLIRGALDA